MSRAGDRVEVKKIIEEAGKVGVKEKTVRNCLVMLKKKKLLRPG